MAAIITAAGYDVFDPSRIPEYRYRELPNVVTAMEFERLLSASGPTGGHLDRPSDRAVEAEIEELEKKARKSEKALEKFEEKFGEKSARILRRFSGGPAPGRRGAEKVGREIRRPPGDQ